MNFVSSKKGLMRFQLKGGVDEYHYEESSKAILVSNEDSTLKLDEVILEKYLHELRKVVDVQLFRLDQSHANMVGAVIAAVGLVSRQDKLFEQIVHIIERVFKDVKTVKPGTVGAFFVGCSRNEIFSGPLGCDPRCAGNLPPPGNFKDYMTCTDSVIMMVDNNFRKFHETHTDHSYIYIDSEQHKGFNTTHAKKLESLGIKFVTLIFGRDGVYEHTSEKMPVKKIVGYTYDPVPDQVSKNELGQESNNNAYIWWWILAIVVVIIIILLIVIALNRRNTRW